MKTFETAFERTLTASDTKQNIPFPVQVPTGTTVFKVRFSYTPWIVDDIHNMLTLTLFDPSGWRGAGHRHGDQHEVVISAAQASPGYCRGPIQAGTWTIVVDTHMIMPGPECTIRLEVSGTDDLVPDSQPPFTPGVTPSRGLGWYRGDLHAHTIHSDANWDVAGLVAFARESQHDFVTLSDHNTVSGLAKLDAARSNDLLTMGGMELTTFWGHALALGLRDWVDWRVHPGERSMLQIEQEVTAQGGLFIIAHPMEIGDPYCTGCCWVYQTMMPGSARVVEVWNGPWISESNNEKGLELVYQWLNQGYRLALTAGTDNHGSRPNEMQYGINNVYAADLTEPEILRAIRAGHLYLSNGPKLILDAVCADQHGMMGESLHQCLAGQHEGNPKPILMTATWEDCPPGARFDWIIDGERREGFLAQKQGSHTLVMKDGQAKWGLATLRSPDGLMLALTNPIYFDGRA